MNQPRSVVVADDRVVPIPELTHSRGPVTRRLMRRIYSVLGSMWAASAVVLLLGPPEALKAFALGLVLPGGGQFYNGQIVAGALVLAGGMGLAWFLSFFLGMMPLVPATWLGAAAIAAMTADDDAWAPALWVVPALLVLLLAFFNGYRILMYRLATRRGQVLNERIASARIPMLRNDGVPEVLESSAEDLKVQRHLLDLALQPLDRFDGFTHIDQFREAAYRYQLTHIVKALAMHQYTRTPAFTGYVAEAQRNAIEKMRDKRVWRYWALENAWGYLRWSPDPIVKDNIMYSGYWGTAIGMYQVVNNDLRYSKPGALSLRWNKKTVFEHDFHTIAQSLRDLMIDSPLGQIPCEPHYIYPFCNTFGVNTLMLHDQLHGTSMADAVIDRVRASYESGDFMAPDGRIIFIKNKNGPSFMPVSTPGDATIAYWGHPALTNIARRTWWIMRNETLRANDGSLRMKFGPIDRVDGGNYLFGKGTHAITFVLAAAKEIGDDEAAEFFQAEIDRRAKVVERDGVRQYKGVSGFCNLMYALARFSRAHALAEIMRVGLPEQWKTGPVLSQAAYPDVLVAKAVSDGVTLDLVLRAGNGHQRTTLELDRLLPGRKYRTFGAAGDFVTAGSDGRALIEVDLTDRNEIHIVPA